VPVVLLPRHKSWLNQPQLWWIIVYQYGKYQPESKTYNISNSRRSSWVLNYLTSKSTWHKICVSQLHCKSTLLQNNSTGFLPVDEVNNKFHYKARHHLLVATTVKCTNNQMRINFWASVLKFLGAQWMVDLYDYYKENSGIICNEFQKWL